MSLKEINEMEESLEKFKLLSKLYWETPAKDFTFGLESAIRSSLRQVKDALKMSTKEAQKYFASFETARNLED